MMQTAPISTMKGEYDESFYAQGKLLISGEYFVLDGAKSLALPISVGQSLSVKYSASYNPSLTWRSFEPSGKMWYEGKFEFWQFQSRENSCEKTTEFLRKILLQVRKQNPHFLREEQDVLVETHLEFPLEWGFGSSSTLIYNIAQWAYTGPFELQFKTSGGSGYDIACAHAGSPILYSKKTDGPRWSPVKFDPEFKDNLYFVYTGRKQDSRKAVNFYEQKGPMPPEVVIAISKITEEMVYCSTLDEFNFLILCHEELISKHLGLKKVKEELFADYFGEVKSLGAWGGDFVLVTSDRSPEETRGYFQSKGYETIIPFCELVFSKNKNPPHGEKADSHVTYH